MPQYYLAKLAESVAPSATHRAAAKKILNFDNVSEKTMEIWRFLVFTCFYLWSSEVVQVLDFICYCKASLRSEQCKVEVVSKAQVVGWINKNQGPSPAQRAQKMQKKQDDSPRVACPHIVCTHKKGWLMSSPSDRPILPVQFGCRFKQKLQQKTTVSTKDISCSSSTVECRTVKPTVRFHSTKVPVASAARREASEDPWSNFSDKR